MAQYTKPKHFGKIVIRKRLANGEVVDYLRRWYLWRCKWFSIRLHHIVLPDVDRDPHDHPWCFLSIVLWGGYHELWTRGYHRSPLGRQWAILARERVVSRFSFHHATDLHRIVEFFRPGGSWTLFITGRERREWGFQTEERWIPWEEYEEMTGAPVDQP